MTSSGEFGATSPTDAALLGIPCTFIEATGTGSLDQSASGVPDGQLWVLLGADFSGAVGSTHALWGSTFSPAGENVGMEEIAGGLKSGWAGFPWRGYMAFIPGTAPKVVAESDNGAAELFAVAWGIILPYGDDGA